MKSNHLLLVGLIFFISCDKTAHTPESVLEKTIAAHDPNNLWPQLNSRFHMSIKRDEQADRYFSIVINNAEKMFEYALQHGDSIIRQGVKGEAYYSSIGGSSDLSDEVKEKYQLSIDRTRYLKEVYEYLYGVPMKLRDPGTIIDPVLREETFNRKACWVLKVTYDPSTEGETWYFYVNKDTYLLEGYRFFFDESKNDGEFIFIDGYEALKGLKLAEIKKWHWNKDSSHFRTDELLRVE